MIRLDSLLIDICDEAYITCNETYNVMVGLLLGHWY